MAVEGLNTYLTIRDSRIADSSASVSNSGKGGGLLAFSTKTGDVCASSGGLATCGEGGGAHSPDEWFVPIDSHLGPQASLLVILGLAGIDGVSDAQLNKL